MTPGGGGRGRALLVRRGVPPSPSVETLPNAEPADGEVLVQVKAAALTPSDVLLCGGPAPPLSDLLPLPSGPSVLGLFFCGEVLALGPYVEGLAVGEPVLGVVDAAALARDAGGCYRENVCVHFSALLPMQALVSAGLHMPSVVAHVPPMVSALFCAASHLRLRAGEALLVVAPRLSDVVFLLQRLLLLGDAWAGPLNLIVLQGPAPTRAELERQPLLRPLVTRAGYDGERSAPTFLDDLVGLSVEDRGPLPPSQVAEALRVEVGRVVAGMHGEGVDVVLALDLDLGPPTPPAPSLEPSGTIDGLPPLGPPGREPPRPQTMLRTLAGALAVNGRLITNCRKVEMMPADGENFWAKEASLSFLNPHCPALSSARHGALLHAMAEVAGRVAAGELPVAEAEVSQFRLFEQFHHAYEAAASRGSRASAGGASPMLVTMLTA